ncbi:MAG: ATPase [Planctomycetaceae bacterium]
MPDQFTADPRTPLPAETPPLAPLRERSAHTLDHYQYDLFASVFHPSVELPGQQSSGINAVRGLHARPVPANVSAGRSQLPVKIVPPPVPTSLDESGLTLMQVSDLVLKQLYLQGSLLGVDMARNARLPFNLVDEVLRFLKDEKCIEVMSGEMIGRASYRFNLTELGRLRAREAFEQCRYVGPAPVSLDSYIHQCKRQTVNGVDCTEESLTRAFSYLVMKPDLIRQLGPAVCSGQSIFIYGPPGNGKTLIAKGLGKYLNLFGGEIYIPYALHTEGAIITLFDPTLHQTTDDVEQQARHTPHELGNDNSRISYEPSVDMRWRRIRRPVVITGGELTLDMLDLRYNKSSNFYTAPLHIKANSGVFLIDDFGRQIVSPRDLLNRWILPLEERIDYLTLVTGKKFSLPFEQLIIFSTNLDPVELVDEAFLRRIRHKIQIGSPDRDYFTEIFRLCCEQKQVQFSVKVIDFLYEHYYDQGKPPRSSDPRDLLEITESICRFQNQPFQLTPELVGEAAQRFFCKL